MTPPEGFEISGDVIVIGENPSNITDFTVHITYIGDDVEKLPTPQLATTDEGIIYISNYEDYASYEGVCFDAYENGSFVSIWHTFTGEQSPINAKNLVTNYLLYFRARATGYRTSDSALFVKKLTTPDISITYNDPDESYRVSLDNIDEYPDEAVLHWNITFGHEVEEGSRTIGEIKADLLRFFIRYVYADDTLGVSVEAYISCDGYENSDTARANNSTPSGGSSVGGR